MKLFKKDQAGRLLGAVVESAQTDARDEWEEITLRLPDGASVTVKGLWFFSGVAGLELAEES